MPKVSRAKARTKWQFKNLRIHDYIIHRELASGWGFADLVFIPRKNVDSPALVVELKYDKETKTHSCVIERWEEV